MLRQQVEAASACSCVMILPLPLGPVGKNNQNTNVCGCAPQPQLCDTHLPTPTNQKNNTRIVLIPIWIKAVISVVTCDPLRAESLVTR